MWTELTQLLFFCHMLHNSIRLHLRTSISFQIVDFNHEIINEEFENDKVWKVIFKSSSFTPFITMVDLTQIQIRKFVDNTLSYGSFNSKYPRLLLTLCTSKYWDTYPSTLCTLLSIHCLGYFESMNNSWGYSRLSITILEDIQS